MFDIYREIALSQIPRILGFGDRDSRSITFGCFDRYYWHYKLTDFPNARFQEVSLLLTLLFITNFEGNSYYNNTNVKKWLLGSIEYWSKILNTNGSTNEVYPFEKSFCSSSFSAYCISESLLQLNQTELIDMKPAGYWLSRYDNNEVSNQMAAATLALYNIYLITSDEEYLIASEEKLKKLYKMQNIEGFFLEYEGVDVGYHTLTMSMLARLHKKKKTKNVLDSLIKAELAVNALIDENGYFNYEKTSRHTQFIYPFAFAYLRTDELRRHARGLKENKILNPAWIDDRYVIQFTYDYLDTYLELLKC